jgi:hypothetical protein
MLLAARIVHTFGLRQRQYDHLECLLGIVDRISIPVAQEGLRSFK